MELKASLDEQKQLASEMSESARLSDDLREQIQIWVFPKIGVPPNHPF